MKEGQSKKRKRARHKKPQKPQQSLQPKHSIKHKKETHQQKNHAHRSSASSKPPKSSSSNSSSFLDKMRARLAGGHFRLINEKLYTCTGKEALDYFQEDPELFDMYHTGYQEQMSHWPEQPVNIIIKWLKDHSSSLIVADFGCGDARLAKNVKNKVFSFDLVSNNPSVIACDMSNIPLDPSSVDVAVFCLSLMGTNYASYLQEAYRVLKPSGWLLIAEVKSRFDPNNGGADPNKFSKAVCEMGFTSALKDFSNKMFVLLYFKKKEKQRSKGKEIEWPELKPCIYKRR
ncbi:PREDICTED: ribosomal RNA-processing protein 8 [Theobroma cacao]|uniref:Ribosomal RNA-processing protein 8 n=2 Tax=Theobroma cacao TaxID=3641 RepID=A0AB32V5R3_THECC|nr:PREDICTED: ribosomal RNA-processing protein 8 [Theobroma cacao]EOY02526.1 S-adenosyl-L-methionine-dependent methyltransferases superfamily protein isoform 1 [Theobroma cacao]